MRPISNGAFLSRGWSVIVIGPRSIAYEQEVIHAHSRQLVVSTPIAAAYRHRARLHAARRVQVLRNPALPHTAQSIALRRGYARVGRRRAVSSRPVHAA